MPLDYVHSLNTASSFAECGNSSYPLSMSASGNSDISTATPCTSLSNWIRSQEGQLSCRDLPSAANGCHWAQLF